MKIPTTERKYYDTGKKLNTLGAYAGALLPAAQSLQEMVKEQQEIKMDSLGVEARMKMNDVTNEWRLQNQSNPNDPAALKDLQSQYDSILGEYRGQIDPMYRSQWDIRGNKLKGAFDVENQNWGFRQRQENAKNDIANSVDNFYKLAYSYGQSGDINKALADFGVSYERLLDYGAKNLGTEDAATLLKDYQSEYAKNYIAGLAETNPQAALNALKDERIKDALGADGLTMASKVITVANKRQKLQNKINSYNEQLNLDNKLEGMNPFEAIGYLEKNKDSFSPKFYKAKMAQYMNDVGVDAETQADTYTDLLTQISSIDKSLKAEDIVNQSNDVLENIEEAYAQRKLKLADKKRLLASLNKIEGKQLPELIKNKSAWYMPYDYNNAKEDFDKSLSNSGLTSQAMLEYHRTLANNEESGLKLDSGDRKKLVKDLVKKYNQNSLNELSKQAENGEMSWQEFSGE